MKKALIFGTMFTVFTFAGNITFGQSQKPEMDKSKKIGEGVKSEIYTASFMGERHPVSADLDWIPTLTHKTVKVEHGFPGMKKWKP